tara:strand:+ start:266 stop:394 length:129 start_codon:yes stop_codon:yes gene_type:complete
MADMVKQGIKKLKPAGGIKTLLITIKKKIEKKAKVLYIICLF